MSLGCLTVEQIGILRCIVDRIIPEDAYPGAWKAGVGVYIERLIAEDAGLIERYRLGLAACDEEAICFFGRPISTLIPSDRDILLARIESAAVLGDWAFDPAEFFKMVVNHTMEGYYADPGNGGNLDGISWNMMGFEVTA